MSKMLLICSKQTAKLPRRTNIPVEMLTLVIFYKSKPLKCNLSLIAKPHNSVSFGFTMTYITESLCYNWIKTSFMPVLVH